jgi:hypothetical protein
MGVLIALAVIFIGIPLISLLWESFRSPKLPTMHLDPYLDAKAGQDKPGWYPKNPPKE